MVVNETAVLTQHPLEFLNTILFGVVNKIIIAAVTLLAGFIIGRITGRLIAVILSQFEISKSISRVYRIGFSIEDVIGRIVSYVIYFLTLLLTLQQFKLAEGVVTVAAIVVAVVVLVHVFVGMQDFVSNAIAGLKVLQTKYVKVGQTVKVGTITGAVVRTTLTETVVKTKEGDILHIPNKILSRSIVIVIKKP